MCFSVVAVALASADMAPAHPHTQPLTRRPGVECYRARKCLVIY